jgi:hypothetical protein
MAKAALPPLDAIRCAIIAALFSDDYLYDHLVLKGGNALRLVYRLQERTSLDLDFSLDTEFFDLADTQRRLTRALRDRLDSAGYVSFDEKLEERPPHPTGRWGGYLLTFKVIAKLEQARLGGELDALRRNALSFGPFQQRNWSVEISRYEYCEGKIPYELDSQSIYVYSPEMLAIEKLRALCQQLPDYPHRRYPAPRARDFYDLHSLATRLSPPPRLDSAGSVKQARAIFRAKEVPIPLLRQIRQARDFHAADWPSVQVSTTGTLRNFDFYFEFVATLAERLEPLWEV